MPCSACGLRWPSHAGVWTRDGAEYDVTQTADGDTWVKVGAEYDVTQTADGDTWVKVGDKEYIPGLLVGLADFRERWFPQPNAPTEPRHG